MVIVGEGWVREKRCVKRYAQEEDRRWRVTISLSAYDRMVCSTGY